MYIITTSFIIEPAAHGQWYEFFTKKFVPHIRTQKFDNLTFTRILHEQNQGDYTYSLQIRIDELSEFNRFKTEVMEEYIQTCSTLFSTKALHFTTIMKSIEI